MEMTKQDPRCAMEQWSAARKAAYQMLHSNPNRFYYRFNAPGERQRNGPWTPQEKSLFLARLAQVGADGNWGIFSMAIPGRVGYQCSNFYRKLIADGEILDRNYTFENGKWKYKPVKVNSKGKRRNRDDDGESDGGKFVARSIKTSAKCEDNPLPDLIDPITLEPVLRPAISPYGHVMGYDSWLKCLGCEATRNTCPITKKPLFRRQLVVLTMENIEMYRDRIIK